VKKKVRNKLLILLVTVEVTLAMSLFRSSNIFKKKLSLIQIFFASEVDNAGTLRSIFWADEKAISLYLSFCDVIVFDITYRTNHLNLPFTPFNGVNHHRQSILFGCALLADEQRDTFVWLFNKLLKCMHEVVPKVIITDQDTQIGDAIKIVFPTTRHR